MNRKCLIIVYIRKGDCMIKQDFLNLMESQSYDIGGIMHELLKIPTYSAFFGDDIINIKYTDFNPLGNRGRSTKVLEFIDKYTDSVQIIGPVHFFEFLTYHHSDNILKLLIKSRVVVSLNSPDPMELFKQRLKEFKGNFFNDESIPFVTNLTTTVLSNKSYTPIQGRDTELKEIQRQFCKLMKNNVILTGSGGAGKTAIVEEFAIREKDNFKVYELNVLSLVARKDEAPAIFETILETLTNIHGNKVLFIDEFHVLVNSGLAETIKRVTSRAIDLKFIVATTSDEFKKYIEKDKALERRFSPIPIQEVSGDVLKNILVDWCEKLKSHFNIDYNPDIIDFVIKNMKVERQKTSPDKEKDVLDSAFSGCSLDNINFVDKDAVAEAMSVRLSIPKAQLLSTMFDILENLEDNIKKVIKGQDYAVKNVVKTIESSQMIKRRNKPLAVMFFAGPTSSGKTELAKQLALHMFGSEDNLIQINCSDYKEKHTMSSLLGSPPGYVNSDNGGALVNKIRQKPFSVILFDEFEKAHRDLQDIMLPMFEEGIVTDRLDRVADVTNCIIILTSNLGADYDNSSSSSKPLKHKSILKMGFDTMHSEEEYDNTQANVTDRYKSYLKSIKKSLKPELISRISEIIIFSKLSEEVIREITINQIDKELKNFELDYNMKITYDDSLVDIIVKKSGNNSRKISTAIGKYIKSAITKAYIKRHISDGSVFKLFDADGQVALEVEIDDEESAVDLNKQ